MAKARKATRTQTESRRLLRHAFELARSLGIAKIMLHADELQDFGSVDACRQGEHLIWVVREPAAHLACRPDRKDVVVRIPDSHLTRMSQVKVALFLAILEGHLEANEGVICLAGIAGSGRLDLLLVTNPRRDFPWFRRHDLGTTREIVPARIFAAVLQVAFLFAVEGREGKPIGTAFVLGNPARLEPYLRQLILNPCAGHPRRARRLSNPQFLETLREYAAMDGAFVVGPSGVVESAGTYLDASTTGARLRAGLGARHAAAAAITADTEAIAVVLSESSGSVSVFHEGRCIMGLEKPMPHESATKITRRKLTRPVLPSSGVRGRWPTKNGRLK